MLNMCIPIPPCLHPDPISSSETLISGSCNDSRLFTTPLPFAASDRSALSMEDGGKEAEEQSELKQDSDAASPEKVLEEREFKGGGENFNGGGEEVLEEQEFSGVEEMVLEEQEPVGGVEKIFEERGHEIVGETGHEVEGDDSEVSPSSSPIRVRDLFNYSKSAARRSHQSEPFRYYSGHNDLKFNSLSDFDENCSDTVLSMHDFPLQPPPSPPPVGAGLANMGNTCFLNAVMQCFTHTVPLVHGLHSLYDYGVPRHHNEGEFCVLSAVREHVFQALASSGEVIFPDNLRFQQEDAHEYLQSLLDKTDTCWSKCRDNIQGFSSQGDSLVNRVFGGRLVSQLHCCNCGSRSDTYEPLVDLSLEIEDADDLQGALKSFTKMEENEDEVKFTCEKCKEKVPLKKQLLIDQAPSVATLHLKRFKGDGDYVEKIDKALEYPLELDLKPYTVGSEDENVDLKYELYAVIVHKGFSSTSGHYLCYIRSSPDKWFRIDDSKITRVREDVALSQQGYILFYARKGTPWPCSLFKLSSDIDICSTSPTSVLDNEHSPHLHPQKASLCIPNAVENSSVMEMEASKELERLPNQQGFTKACCIGPSRNSNESVLSEPSVLPSKKVCNDELIARHSSLSSAPKDNEAEFIRSADAQVHMFIIEGDEHSRHVPTGDSTKLSNKQDTNGTKGDTNISKFCKSRSLSPDIYSDSEDHPAVAHPQPLKKPKIVKNATPRKGNSGMTLNDRKVREAQRLLRGLPSSRRHTLMAAVLNSRRRSY
ncbi:hypothetical protein V2J09_022419 [Rumex salicifolius]